MVERVVERGKEPEPKELAYELSYRLRAEFRKQRAEGKVVVRSKDIEWEQNRQGFIKYMSHDGNWKQQAVPLSAKKVIVPTPQDIEQQARLFREGFISKLWQPK